MKKILARIILATFLLILLTLLVCGMILDGNFAIAITSAAGVLAVTFVITWAFRNA